MSASRPAKYREHGRPGPRMLHRGRRVAPRRTGGSSPASKTGSARLTGRRPAATCAPARPADPGWRSRRVVGSGHRAGALQVESTGEHRTPLQQRLLRVIEVVVGPRHRVAQRLVACQAAPRAHQQPEPLIETITHLAGGHRRHPRGRQLDGQRDAVESAADLHYSVRLVRLWPPRSRGGDAMGTFDEQGHCGRVDTRADVQRRHRPQLFVGDPQSFAAGGQDRHGRRVREDGLDQIGGGVDARARSCRTPAAGPCPPTRRPPTRSRSCPVAG